VADALDALTGELQARLPRQAHDAAQRQCAALSIRHRLACHSSADPRKEREERDAGGAAGRAAERASDATPSPEAASASAASARGCQLVVRAAPLTSALATFFRSSPSLGLARALFRSCQATLLSAVCSCLLCRSFGGVSLCWLAARRRSPSRWLEAARGRWGARRKRHAALSRASPLCAPLRHRWLAAKLPQRRGSVYLWVLSAPLCARERRRGEACT
jgi:hypothetical protein